MLELKDKKLCRICGEEKEPSEFYLNPRNKDGLISYCKKCSKENSKEWAKNHPDKIAIFNRRYKRKHPQHDLASYTRKRINSKEKKVIKLLEEIKKLKSLLSGIIKT
jgi:ribosomal protein L44E